MCGCSMGVRGKGRTREKRDRKKEKEGEGEREREREREREPREKKTEEYSGFVQGCNLFMIVCVSVCVCPVARICMIYSITPPVLS